MVKVKALTLTRTDRQSGGVQYLSIAEKKRKPKWGARLWDGWMDGWMDG